MEHKSIEGFGLSPQQKHLWLLQQNSVAYRAQCAILLEGDLKVGVLKEALQKVINRHEILRTAFRCLSGMTIPLQVITDNSIPSWQNVSLSGWDAKAQEAKIEELFQAEGRRAFDFEQDSLLRVSLIVLSPDKHMLLVSLPALCADVWTLKNLVHEISRSYAACLQNEVLADEPMQYADFSEWQNQILQAEDTEVGREYWREYWLQLDTSALHTLTLPFEGRSGNEAIFEPEFLSFVIDPDVIAKIEAIVLKSDTSASVFLLACWQTLLWRLTGQSDITVGTSYDGRRYEELEEALGLFAKYLPINCHLEENLKFSEILEHVNESTHEVYKRQESFNWEQIGESAGHVIEQSSFPLCFSFEEQPAKYSAASVSFSIYRQYTCIDRFKVKLSCVRRDNSLITEISYDPNLFERENIKRIAGHFEALVKSAVQNPEAAASELEILSDVERHQLLVEWNNTQTDYPTDKCVHELFEAQVERRPDNIAVVYEQEQLTYRELNARANRLAHYLRKRGVGPETVVGLCVERSLEMIVGLLGILKAGGAYVPLDPAYPQERLSFMIEDTEAPVLLTQQRLVEGLPENEAHVVCLDTRWEVIAKESNENPISGATPENLVYVIYTSGSTGRPKGVAIEHQQLLNYLGGILERLSLPIDTSFATVSTFAADLGNTAVFPGLCSGGCLHVVSQERASDPNALADYVLRRPIDCLKIVPSHLAALLASSKPGQILPRKRLVLGGETSSWNLIEKLQVLAPDCLILNHYGPTEATVGVLTYRVEKGQKGHRSATLPLGRPIANTQVYVLDRHLQPVPIGVPGELHIGGAGLARGYLNRPELTGERFIPNPFSDKVGARLYKTGDLARYLPDGNVEYLGRIDHQVKIRGFRIELGEIETVLAEHPSVRETVVLVREDVPGDKRLLAYVVAARGQTPTISELRSWLKEKLPDYMVPSAFVMLDGLPLTPNGKVDRRALPAPDQARPELERAFVAPRNSTEEVLAGIWVEVLGVEQVGVCDDFFELGGHSLLATQVISRIQEAFQLELPLRCLFESPTVAGLAESMESLSGPAQNIAKTAQVLIALNQLSEDEVKAMLEFNL